MNFFLLLPDNLAKSRQVLILAITSNAINLIPKQVFMYEAGEGKGGELLGKEVIRGMQYKAMHCELIFLLNLLQDYN